MLRSRAIAFGWLGALCGGAVYFGLRAAGPPQRCGAGFEASALGGRCCAPGQHVDPRAFSCVGEPRVCPAPLVRSAHGCSAPARTVRFEPGALTIGPSDWEMEGDVPSTEVRVEHAFLLDAFEIDVERHLACIAAGACAGPQSEPDGGRAALLSADEARVLCAFAKGRLPTDDEWTYAAMGKTAHGYPWGDTGAVCHRAAFGLKKGPCAEGARGPDTVGAHTDGASPEGVFDLAGNVAEWTTKRAGAAETSLRGGNWSSPGVRSLRGWNRDDDPAAHPGTAGARCAYDPP